MNTEIEEDSGKNRRQRETRSPESLSKHSLDSLCWRLEKPAQISLSACLVKTKIFLYTKKRNFFLLEKPMNSPIRRPPLPEHSRVKVAILLAEGRKPKEVAGILGISESSVSKLRKEATEPENGEKRLLGNPSLYEHNIPDNLLVQLRMEIVGNDRLLKQIQQLGPSRLQSLQILGPSTHDGDSTFYRSAARYLKEKVFPNFKYAGVSWGHCMTELVNAMEADDKNFRSSGEFVQICGDPHYATTTSTRGSDLVNKLNKKVFGKTNSAYTFSFPAMIPAEFGEDECVVIRNFLMKDEGFSSIFGLKNNRLHLKPQLDLIITSCGTNSRHDSWLIEMKKRGLAKHTRFKELRGNICGLWFADSTSNEDLEFEVNERWNGMGFEDLSRVSQKRQGVILLVDHEEKSETALSLVRRGFVNHLLLCHEAASKIEEIIS